MSLIKFSYNAVETMTVSVTDHSSWIDRSIAVGQSILELCTTNNIFGLMRFSSTFVRWLMTSNISGPKTWSAHIAFVVFTIPPGLCSRFAYLNLYYIPCLQYMRNNSCSCNAVRTASDVHV